MGKWTEQFIETDGIKICIHRTGGDKQPVVLLHGISDDGLCWTRVAKALEAEFDVIMVDQRGHGKSAIDRSDFSFELLADDVAGVIRALDLGRPVIVGGHSMGGQAATVLAAKYPELVSRVFLEDPMYFLNPFLRFMVRLFVPLILRSSRKNATKDPKEIEHGCKKLHPEWIDEDLAPWVVAQQAFGTNLVNGKLGKVNIAVDWKDTFQKIKCPALIIIPSKGLMSPKQVEGFKPLFTDLRMVYIEGAGHSVRREQYEKYIAAVLAFCRER
jgi:N-formylmaleamate deformylase